MTPSVIGSGTCHSVSHTRELHTEEYTKTYEVMYNPYSDMNTCTTRTNPQ